VFRPTGFAELAGKRVGIFGYGLEGRATRRRVEDVAAEVVVVDDASGLGSDVIVSSEGGLEALLGCDVVLKSPGIPRRRADVLDLEHHGVTVTSSLNLWLHDIDRSRVVAITGTKGKSTTTALTTFFLQRLGEAALRLGNFGQPPYDPDLDVSKGWLILEVSSFQCVDIDVAPGLVVVTSLGADHLDWHGTLEEYRRDKLSLTRAPGEHRTLVPENATMHDYAAEIGGDVMFVAPDETGSRELTRAPRRTQRHQRRPRAPLRCPPRQPERRRGSCASLRLGPSLRAASRSTHGSDERSRGRRNDALRRRRTGDLGVAVVAALEVFDDEPVALIVGGFDRGVDYAPLAEAIAARRQPMVLITMGEAGKRIGDEVTRLAPVILQIAVSSMRDAVSEARNSLEGGVVLLSPGAPSFDQYKNWEERSEDFTTIVHKLTRK